MLRKRECQRGHGRDLGWTQRDGGEMCYGKESVSVDMEMIWGGHREMVVRCAMENRVSAMT